MCLAHMEVFKCEPLKIRGVTLQSGVPASLGTGRVGQGWSRVATRLLGLGALSISWCSSCTRPTFSLSEGRRPRLCRQDGEPAACTPAVRPGFRTLKCFPHPCPRQGRQPGPDPPPPKAPEGPGPLAQQQAASNSPALSDTTRSQPHSLAFVT